MWSLAIGVGLCMLFVRQNTRINWAFTSFCGPLLPTEVARLAHLVKAFCYKPEGRGFDSRWARWEFSFT